MEKRCHYFQNKNLKKEYFIVSKQIKSILIYYFKTKLSNKIKKELTKKNWYYTT